MCDHSEKTCLRLRNKAQKIKIQIEDKQFAAFSFVADHTECVDSCSQEKVDDWTFWPDCQIAIHSSSPEALKSLSQFSGVVLRWCTDEDVLTALNICSEDVSQRDAIIEAVANASLRGREKLSQRA